jgi:hypothetical protein
MSKTGRSIAYSCAALILVALCVTVAECSSPLNIQVAGMTDQKRIKIRDALTAEQLKRFDDWSQRNPMASKGVPRGVTVKQALLEEDAWLAKRSAEAARAKELKKRVQAERAAKQEELARIVSVTLLSKKNEVHVDEQHYVALEIAYDNKTDKAIRSVVGVLRLSDIYGDAIMDISRSYGGGISAKQTAVDHGAVVSINKSLDPQEKLWETDFPKIRTTFEVNTIVFQDGTTMQVPQGGV